MLVLGANLEHTRTGKTLKDGGLCVLDGDRVILAIAEERITRVKHDGGFEASLEYAQNALDVKISDFDALVFSSCSEPFRFPQEVAQALTLGNSERVHTISHHLSHAYSAFFASPFEQALVIVMDAGGDVLDKAGDTVPWWHCRREQFSYFVGGDGTLTLLGRDFDTPFEAGFGEAFRAFTYYLGWHSYVYAGKTMAVAAFGDPERFRDVRLFGIKNGRLVSCIRNDPPNPIGMVEEFAARTGIEIPDPRSPENPTLLQAHYDLAYLLQDQFERALVEKIILLSRSTGIKNLCIAGGVGLNCVANSQITRKTPIEGLFIQPACGDTGQCLGNAIYGVQVLSGRAPSLRDFTPYLGGDHQIPESFPYAQPEVKTRIWQVSRPGNLAREVANLLSEGCLVALCHGRSEFGPRALGNRSILADPRYQVNRARLGKVKGRERFLPFAPSVLLDRADEYFEPIGPEPYMLRVAKAKPYKRHWIQAAVHRNSMARLQTVSKEENPFFYEVILEFARKTGIPVVVNTSFNGPGEPIVETPDDAISTFRRLDLDALVLDRFLIKRKGYATRTASVMAEARRRYEPDLPLKRLVYDLSQMRAEEMIEQLEKDLPKLDIIPRSCLGFYREYIEWLRSGKKLTTIRYRRSEEGCQIHCPAKCVLPLMDTGKRGASDDQPQPAGHVKVVRFEVKPFKWLDDADGRNDGFADGAELRAELGKIYGPVPESDYVSIYTIQLHRA